MAHRPLSELTRRQKLMIKLGGAAIERVTSEQIKDATLGNLLDIKAIFEKRKLTETKHHLETNKLELTTISSNAGLPNTRVSFQDITTDGPVITFLSPSEADTPEGISSTLLFDPTFRVAGEEVEARLISSPGFHLKPFDRLSASQQILAFSLTTDVAQTMLDGLNAGSLEIH